MKTVKFYYSNTIYGVEAEKDIEFEEIENGCVLKDVEERFKDDFETCESFGNWFCEKYEHEKTELAMIVTDVKSAETYHYFSVYYKLRRNNETIST